MLVVDRTHPLERDLDWAPRKLKAPWLRHYHRGQEESLEPLATVALIPVLDMIFFPILILAAVTRFVLRDRSATYDEALERRAFDSLSGSAIDFTELESSPADLLVRVTGRVVAAAETEGVISRRRGVACRLAYRVEGKWWIHESAVEFELEDKQGRRIAVKVANARILTRLGTPEERTTRDFLHDAVPTGIRACFHPARPPNSIVRCAERVLEDGAQVTLFGYRAPVETGAGYRAAPERVTLTSGKLPLLIVF